MIAQETELDVLSEIAQSLTWRTGQRELIEHILGTLTARLGMIRGTVMISSSEGRELVVETPVAAGAAREGHLRRGETIIGRVFATGQPAIVTRPAADGSFGGNGGSRESGRAQPCSSVCVPIVMGHEVVGTLAADLPGDGEAGALEAEKKMLAVVAGMIAADVRNRRAARLERELLEGENQRLLAMLREQYRPESIVGNSRAMREVYQRIRQVAGSEVPMLIRGEAGTGKELVATAIHFASARATQPLVRVNCAGLGSAQLEAELFGLEKGLAVGAPPRRAGRIEEAEGGTLFLDEIADFPPALQIRLLRLMQDHEYERAGAIQARKANVRLIAATRRDLDGAVAAGRFRQDLYYRLSVCPIDLPPLRERRGDILLLANHFAAFHAARLGRIVRRISTPAIEMLLAYHWPGNVRELENAIEHALLQGDDEVIHGHHLPPTLQTPHADEKACATLKHQIHALEREMIVDALKRNGGSIAVASKELGITGRMVRYKIKQLEINYRALFNSRAARHEAEGA